MENEEIIYDIEGEALEREAHQPPKGGVEDGCNQDNSDNSDSSDSSDNSDNSDSSDISDNSDSSDSSDNSDNSEAEDGAEASEADQEIRRMVAEMGAETLLEIIRDNRNAACRQILEEVRLQSRPEIPSGVAATARPSSIFDLAAMA